MKLTKQIVLSLTAISMLSLVTLMILLNGKPSIQTGQGTDEYYSYLPAVFNNLVVDNVISKGIATPNGTPSCQDAENVNAEWDYNWTGSPDTGCTLTEKFVPRIWGESGMPILDQFLNN